MKQLFVVFMLSFSVFAADKVVYGVDGRLELDRTPFASLSSSVAGMVPSYNLIETKDGMKVASVSTLETYRGRETCGDMQFREQPTVANCTGFLVADDILVTAGHCVTNPGRTVNNEVTSACRSYKWVFDYNDNSQVDGEIVFPKKDVVGCKKVIAASYTGDIDFAVIKLDRKLTDKTPVKISADESNYEADEKIFVVGHPSGLPVKLASGASVKKKEEHTFVTNLDTFAGNSGSPIFNFYGDVVGILVSGEQDYRWDSTRQCVAVNVCLDYDDKCDQSYTGKGMGETGTKIKFVKWVLDRELKKEK